MRSDTVIRDIGSLLNSMLTQNLRQASMRASMQRKVGSEWLGHYLLLLDVLLIVNVIKTALDARF